MSIFFAVCGRVLPQFPIGLHPIIGEQGLISCKQVTACIQDTKLQKSSLLKLVLTIEASIYAGASWSYLSVKNAFFPGTEIDRLDVSMFSSAGLQATK